MKNSITKIFGILALCGTLFVSCTVSEDEPTSSFVVDPNNLQGNINDGEVTLNANTIYYLTGRLQINDGASLIIPAGTIIKASGGTSAYVAVAQGGKIFVNGTSTSPVVFTSASSTPQAGNWGGIVICGKAPINRVTGGTSTAQSEVADLTYGGTISNDNSGVLRYMRIEYAGAAFNTEKEFNGLSLFGVGNGTTIEYVQCFNGADDGFEFFGGTVNTSNLISIGNEDDQFDWTEGWSGTNSNWYGKLDFGRGNRGIEADNFELGFTNTPIANPTISNISLIGPGSAANTTTFAENQGLKLRRGTKGIFSNLYIADWKTGFDVEHDECIAAVTAQTLKATNVTFGSDVPTKAKEKTTAGVTTNSSAIYTEATTATTGAGNGAGKPSWANNWSVGF